MHNELRKTYLLLKSLKVIPLLLYYIIESIILKFVPKHLLFKDVTGDVVLITGAGSGIGRELAILFAQKGAKLALLDINLKGLEETKSFLDKYVTPVFVYECDVSKRENVYEVAAKVKRELGNVTILINNAGIVTGKLFLDCPDHMMQKTMEVNVMAHFWTCKAFLPDMKAANHGHIVSIASLAGYGGIPKMTDYTASKFAAVGFEESLRTELYCERLHGIHTTVVLPFLINTGLFEGFQWPFLEGFSPQVVAKRIFSGILANEEVIIIPGFLSIYRMVSGFLPRKAMLLLSEANGTFQCMDNFKGRKQD